MTLSFDPGPKNRSEAISESKKRSSIRSKAPRGVAPGHVEVVITGRGWVVGVDGGVKVRGVARGMRESHKIERSERQERDTEWCRWQPAASLPSSASAASCRYYSPNAEYHSKFESARSRPNSSRGVSCSFGSFKARSTAPPGYAFRGQTRWINNQRREKRGPNVKQRYLTAQSTLGRPLWRSAERWGTIELFCEPFRVHGILHGVRRVAFTFSGEFAGWGKFSRMDY